MLIDGDKIATKQWVRHRVRYYARRAGMKSMPRVTFGQIDGSSETSAGDKGEYNYVTGVIKVDLDGHLCRHDMLDTVIHEVVHARWPGLVHNAVFLRRIRALRDGHVCGVRGSPLPSDFR